MSGYRPPNQFPDDDELNGRSPAVDPAIIDVIATAASGRPGAGGRPRARMAGGVPLELGKRLRGMGKLGALAGLGTLGSAIAAAAELGDQADPLGKNASEAVGQFAGGGAGAWGGAALGGMLGGPAAPLTAAIGAGIGGILGGIGGSVAGKSVGGGLYNAVAGDPSDPLRQQQRAFDMALDNEVKRAQAMLGPQAAAAAIAQRNEIERARAMAALQNQQITQQALAASMLAQQQAGAAGLDRMTAAILGYGGGGYGV